MSNGLGVSSVISHAGRSALNEIIRHRGPAKPHVLSIHNRGPESVLIALTRRRDGLVTSLKANEQVQVAADDSAGYTGTGSLKTFTGGALGFTADAFLPGTVIVNATVDSPAMRDVDGDGILWQQLGARKQGASGTFAAMAAEVMTVSVDGGAPQTVTFGTEATIGDAAALIATQLTGATALEQGAQDVDITSESLGKGSSIEVLTVAAGITTKLGITAGLSTNMGGTIDYFTGALELVYQGYDPTNLEDITADYLSTPELIGNSGIVMRVPVSDIDDIIVSAYGNGGTPVVEASISVSP